MTWHAASFMTSYITDPGAGDHTADQDDEAFPHSTTSWFYLAGLEVRRADAATVLAFGDSITDGFFSNINGNDTWPDDLQRRLIARERAGRGCPSSTRASPATWSRTSAGCRAAARHAMGPARLVRLDRDLLASPTSGSPSCSKASTTSAAAAPPRSRSSTA